MQGGHGAFRGLIVLRGWVELGLQRAGDIGHRRLDLLHQFGALLLEPLPDLVRCLCYQLLENMLGDILPPAELFGENGIVFGVLDQVLESEFREARAVVGRDGGHDFLVAAGDEHVGNHLHEGFPFRDREQMRLALEAGVGDHGIGFETFGFLEDGSGDIDRIVKGKRVEDIDRRVVEVGQPLRELHAGRDLDLAREPADDGAEGLDFILAKAAAGHQIGGMPQRTLPAFRRSARNDLVEPFEQWICLGHLLITLISSTQSVGG